MSMTNDSKSPEEIEREVEMARAEVRSTLGDIRESLSPGQMLDQALDYVRGSGGADFTRNLGRSVRDNPVPVALIGAGIGWLLLSDRLGPRHRPRYTADELYTDPDRHHVHVDGDAHLSSRTGEGIHRARDAAHRAGELGAEARARGERAASSLGAAAASARDRVAEGAGTLRDGARRMSHDVRDQVSETAAAAYGYAESVGDRVRHAGDGLRGAGNRLRAASDDARSQAARIFEEQPLVIGALGFVVGAVIGAALPRSRQEDRLFGSTADRVRRSAREAAREGLREVADVATEAVHEAGRTLDERGLSGRGFAETVSAVGETVREAVAPSESRDDDGRTASGKTEAASGVGAAPASTNGGAGRKAASTGGEAGSRH